ncbi:MAG: hypothetical protein BBJ57_09465 [Desulfobacterales bacterium PC51MH44]|nr:MAG: hypothetical protein BBJ57_09465 [Desulfobacterales bacterium PC51MH44]
MKILINGAGFENKGAEAMVRTVQAELAKRLPSVDLFLWRVSVWNHRIATDSGMNPLTLPFELPYSKWRLLGERTGKTLWSVQEICHMMGMKQIWLLFDRSKRFDKACDCYLQRTTEGFDALIDISGFAYGDVWGVGGFGKIRPVIDYCKQYDKPAFFLPQAWGSFDNPHVKKAVRKLLSGKGVSFYSRDKSSCRYLEEALDKPKGFIASYPDIVFRFQGGTQEQGKQILRNMGCSMKRPLIGISPNRRIFERVAGEGTGNEYLRALVKLVKHCLESHNVDVVLQANEICEYGNRMDDRYLCSLIAASVSRVDRCFMTRDSLTAEATKALIGQFDYMIGSRFHSLVFAFSQGVPGMAVSWSHKYRELFSLFGMESDVHECKDIDADALIETFERGWNKRRQRRPLILEQTKHLQAEVDTLFNKVSERIHGEAQSSTSNSVKDVVDRHLCTQCGTCVSVCPVGAIEMRETPTGLLSPSVLGEKCVQCGKCLELCPGLAVEISLPEGVDPFRGKVCAAYVGHACDELVRSTGQSGGVVSALLLYLLEAGRVNAALVTTMPADGSLRPKPMLARTRSDILAAQGSKYCPVAANTALKDIAANDCIAVVGSSCQIHGISMLTQHRNALKGNIQCKIGLFCDRTMLYTCIDMMAKNAELDRTEIAGLKYRSKARNGWPGEVCFQLDSGQNRYFPSSLRIRLKDYFTPPRCRLCFDKMNVLSDLSIGDAWGVSKLAKGDSVVIARNDKAVSLLKDACDSGFLRLREIDAELIFKGQGVEQRRQDFVAYSDVWREMGRTLPEYKGLDSGFLVLVDSTTRSVFRRKLSLNCRVAESKTKQTALACARRQQRMDKAKSLVKNLFGKLKRNLKRLFKALLID